MKFTILIFFAFFSLSAPIEGLGNAADGQSNGRTNYTDSQGLRQGYWRIVGAMTIEEGYKPDQLVEEGEYVNNKREGIWKKYFATGGLRTEITYSENHPYGYYKTYYPSGKTEEEGYWKSNKNTGEFKRFHPNGKKAQEFNFNSHGKRDGEQRYYYENGHPQIAVQIENGVAHGEYLAFYPDGKLKESKRYTNGEVEMGSEQVFESGKPFTNVSENVLSNAELTRSDSDRPNLEEFRSNGFNSLYNKNKQLSQVGEFKNGRIWDGKWYKYDENGLIKKLEIYKAGRFIGYGIIEDSDK